MDTRLRILIRQYALSRDSETAVKGMEELLRSGAGGEVTIYEVHYEPLEGFRMDEKYSCGVFLTLAEAKEQVRQLITSQLDDYDEESDEEGEEIWDANASKTVRELLKQDKIKEAIIAFEEHYQQIYLIAEHKL